jgi:hypothetical protein
MLNEIENASDRTVLCIRPILQAISGRVILSEAKNL